MRGPRQPATSASFPTETMQRPPPTLPLRKSVYVARPIRRHGRSRHSVRVKPPHGGIRPTDQTTEYRSRAWLPSCLTPKPGGMFAVATCLRHREARGLPKPYDAGSHGNCAPDKCFRRGRFLPTSAQVGLRLSGSARRRGVHPSSRIPPSGRNRSPDSRLEGFSPAAPRSAGRSERQAVSAPGVHPFSAVIS